MDHRQSEPSSLSPICRRLGTCKRTTSYGLTWCQGPSETTIRRRMVTSLKIELSQFVPSHDRKGTDIGNTPCGLFGVERPSTQPSVCQNPTLDYVKGSHAGKPSVELRVSILWTPFPFAGVSKIGDSTKWWSRPTERKFASSVGVRIQRVPIVCLGEIAESSLSPLVDSVSSRIVP